jgi:hypothetical protein
MRIAGIGKQRTANVYYRAVLPLMELRRRGHTVLELSGPEIAAAAGGGRRAFDVLLMQQMWGEDDLRLVRDLRRRGIGVIWDTDDDISQIPKGSGAYRHFGRKRGIRKLFERTIEIARAACVMTTPSEHLAQLYRDAGVESVMVIENHVASRDIVRSKRPRRGVMIGCTAALEHATDLRGLRIADVLGRILRDHEEVGVMTIGERLDLKDHRYRSVKRVEVERLVMTEQAFDIGIAPLLDSPLNRSRSNVKLKEYAAAGAMWLASPVGPYVGMGEQQGGLLVPDDAWEDALRAIIGDYTKRQQLRRAAVCWARTQTIERKGDAWERAARAAKAMAGRPLAG